MFDRLIGLIGQQNFDYIKSKKVIVFGVGGVGGYVVEALVRSGIMDITIVDYDRVDESNLNRQIIALHSTIGEYKVEALRKRMLDINPKLTIKSRCEKASSDSLDIYDLKNYDYVIDCLDDTLVKVALAKYSLEKNIKLVMSTGTAKKMHPEYLKMTTLDKTNYDPLARKLRTMLRGEPTNKIVVLASDEKIIGDKNILGSSVFVPASGGLLIASYVINDIIK